MTMEDWTVDGDGVWHGDKWHPLPAMAHDRECIDRLTSDKARLASELAAEQESNTFLNNLHTVDAERIKALEEALQAVRDARLDWAMVCPCSCDACDRFYESVRVATSAETKGEQT